MNHRTHIIIPQDLALEIERLVGKRGRSQFLVEAAWKELKRRRMLASIDTATGSWLQKNQRASKRTTELSDRRPDEKEPSS